MTTPHADQSPPAHLSGELRRHVLIVDDSEIERQLFRDYLVTDQEVNYVVSESGSVAEAVLCIRKRLPDCILLDYMLPGENGLVLLEYVQCILSATPVAVLLVTAHGDEAVAAAAIRAGAVDYLTKDELDQEVLRRAVDSAMEKVNMRRELILQGAQLRQRNCELKETRARLEEQNKQLFANQRALMNIMDDLEAEIHRRRRAEQLA